MFQAARAQCGLHFRSLVLALLIGFLPFSSVNAELIFPDPIPRPHPFELLPQLNLTLLVSDQEGARARGRGRLFDVTLYNSDVLVFPTPHALARLRASALNRNGLVRVDMKLDYPLPDIPTFALHEQLAKIEVTIETIHGVEVDRAVIEFPRIQTIEPLDPVRRHRVTLDNGRRFRDHGEPVVVRIVVRGRYGFGFILEPL